MDKTTSRQDQSSATLNTREKKWSPCFTSNLPHPKVLKYFVLDPQGLNDSFEVRLLMRAAAKPINSESASENM